MNVSFDGFNENVLTFNYQGDVCSEALVKISSNGTVAPCADGDKIAGVARNADGECAAVQVGGYVTCAYTGTAPTVGYCGMLAGGANAVKSATTGGIMYLVLDVDTVTKTVGFLL